MENDIAVADITTLNFNVVYELGYAIGLGKRGLPVFNKAYQGNQKQIDEIGIFDTLLYETYSTSSELLDLLKAAKPGRRIATEYPIDPLPLFMVLPPVITDYSNQLTDRARRAGLRPRTFDLAEQARLAATEAARSVGSSSGVALQLLSSEMRGAEVHNIRTAFVAGLAHALGKPTLILKNGSWPAPLDIRDEVKSFETETQLAAAFNEFAASVHESRYASPPPAHGPANPLANIKFGEPAAENEETQLDHYFLERDEFRQVLDGRAKIVVGRKGSGKTAVFYQVRNRLRDSRSNVILDLSPEAYQLRKLKDVVLKCLAAGSKEFLLSAFWEYVLLLEISGKIIEKDLDVHKRNHKLFEPYQRLLKFYRSETTTVGISFSDRLVRLIERLSERYLAGFGDKEGVDLSDGQVTNLLYETTLTELRAHLIDYAKNKGMIYILFDNIDKGWNATGLEDSDVIIVRTLIDAMRKLGNDFRRVVPNFYSAVFLRNDVFEALLSNTPDRGKDSIVLVDWVMPDLLAQLVKKRIASNMSTASMTVDQVWHNICVPLVDGQNSLDYLISRSLMRPRYLIRLLNHCRGNAINFDRGRIDEADIENGLSTYSTEIIKEIELEVKDVLPAADSVLYVFLGERSEMRKTEFEALLERSGRTKDIARAIFVLLLWHGVLGLRRTPDSISYIHDVNYDIRRMNGLIDKLENGDPMICINPALWPGLEIREVT